MESVDEFMSHRLAEWHVNGSGNLIYLRDTPSWGEGTKSSLRGQGLSVQSDGQQSYRKLLPKNEHNILLMRPIICW